MTEEHHIETLDDLIEVAHTTDDLDGLIVDLGGWLRLAVEVEWPEGVTYKPVFIWKDDQTEGLSGFRIDITGTDD